MIAGVYNINLDQGATFRRSIVVKNPDESLFDFTNHTARMQIRPEIDSDDVMIELTTENGRIALGGTNGTIQLTIDADDTEAIQYDGVYDLEIINNSGSVFRLLKGIVRLDYEVTR